MTHHLKRRAVVAVLMLFGIQAVSIAGPPNQVMMQAVVAHEYGAPETLKLENVPRPAPKENEVLVRVIASAVNPADALIVSGKYAKEFGTHLPLVPGYDIAGVIEQAGTKVTRLKAGDPVYAYVLWGGGFATYAVATEGEATLKPASCSYVEAASMPLAALTAWQALIDAAGLSAGQTVLIHGGSGGVGTMAIQIAKSRGARVIATASTANQDLLTSLGADVAVDYSKQNFEDVARDVDVVLDTVGKDTLQRSYGVVKRGGFIVTLVARLDQAELDRRGIHGASIAAKPNASELGQITKLIEAKKIKPLVSQELPLAGASGAVKQAGTHHTHGKIVIRLADEPKN